MSARRGERGLQGRAPGPPAQPPGRPLHPTHLHPQVSSDAQTSNHHVCKVLMYHQLLSLVKVPPKFPSGQELAESLVFPLVAFCRCQTTGSRRPQLSTGCAPLTPMLQSAESLPFHH